MSTNYRDAAVRHYLDGDALLRGRSFPNADQVYGLSAECSLKVVMVGLGMQTTKKGAPKDHAHKVHMPELWMAFQSFAEGRLASRYLEPLAHLNPFDDWSVDQRYWGSSAFDAARAGDHRKAAAMCRESMERAVVDGVCR
jgi:hypothetical protein